MYFELEGVIFLSRDLNDIVEVTLDISLKGDIKLDGEACCHWALHVVVAAELISLGRDELDTTHLLRDVLDLDSHLVILMNLDIYGHNCRTIEVNLGREHVDGRPSSESSGGRVVEHWLRVLLQNAGSAGRVKSF